MSFRAKYPDSKIIKPTIDSLFYLVNELFDPLFELFVLLRKRYFSLILC